MLILVRHKEKSIVQIQKLPLTTGQEIANFKSKSEATIIQMI